MWGHLSKYAPLFLVLAVSGLILLLRNIHTLEKFNCQTVSALHQLQTKLDTAFRSSGLLQLDRNRSYCGLFGPELTADEAAEERHLLESVAWPEPRLSAVPFRQSSDPRRSFFVILSSGGEWHVGSQLEVLVHMHDFQGKPKRHGGDFLLARLFSPELRAGVAGRVVDHQNGFYSIVFWLPWAGPAQVEVILVHSSEAVQVLRRLREERPDRVFFKSLFRSGFFSETAVCNLCLPPGQPLCNYTDRHTGEPWFCYKPKLLGCDTRINHAKGGYQKDLLTSQEALLFQSDFNIKVPIQASGPNHVIVLPEGQERLEAERGVNVETATFRPSGYYYQGAWQTVDGAPVQQFNDTSAITDCLRGKVVNLYGDSTARQWFEYLNAFVPDWSATGTMKPQAFVGVRVKNPVKELILQKHRNQQSWSSTYQNKAEPHSSTVYPHGSAPFEIRTYPVQPAGNLEDLSAAMANGFYIPPLSPQPDRSPPPQSLSVEPRSGVSFFQWQIKQEEEKVARMMPEQLVAQDSDGDTLLHIAVAQGRRALSFVLARNMAHVNMLDVKDHNGQSALQVSVVANQHLIAQDLITLRAQINTVDCWGRTPLHVCAEKGHELTLQDIHKALGATGQKVNIETVNYDGRTALHAAVLAHNAVLKDSLDGEAVQMQALLQRRKQLKACIKTLLLMGASYRSKVYRRPHITCTLTSTSALLYMHPHLHLHPHLHRRP